MYRREAGQGVVSLNFNMIRLCGSLQLKNSSTRFANIKFNQLKLRIWPDIYIYIYVYSYLDIRNFRIFTPIIQFLYQEE